MFILLKIFSPSNKDDCKWIKYMLFCSHTEGIGVQITLYKLLNDKEEKTNMQWSIILIFFTEAFTMQRDNFKRESLPTEFVS